MVHLHAAQPEAERVRRGVQAARRLAGYLAGRLRVAVLARAHLEVEDARLGVGVCEVLQHDVLDASLAGPACAAGTSWPTCCTADRRTSWRSWSPRCRTREQSCQRTDGWMTASPPLLPLHAHSASLVSSGCHCVACSALVSAAVSAALPLPLTVVRLCCCGRSVSRLLAISSVSCSRSSSP